MCRNEEVEDALLESDASELPSSPPVAAAAAEARPAEHAEPPAVARAHLDPSAQYARYRCRC